MHVLARPLPGMLVLQAEPHADARGAFTRLFCRETLGRFGLDPAVAQANLSESPQLGTLRGMHYQLGSSAETKVVTCLQGRLYDVVLDLRPGSPSFGRSAGVELSRANRRLVVVPQGCAHGFLTLEDDTVAFYLVSSAYDPLRERGVRWDDPAFAIAWPGRPRHLSNRDASHPDFEPGFHLAA